MISYLNTLRKDCVLIFYTPPPPLNTTNSEASNGRERSFQYGVPVSRQCSLAVMATILFKDDMEVGSPVIGSDDLTAQAAIAWLQAGQGLITRREEEVGKRRQMLKGPGRLGEVRCEETLGRGQYELP